MDSFSWSDAIKACLPCLQPSASEEPGPHRIPRARPDELEGLLADAETDTEGETLSLHSNVGDGNRDRSRRKRRKNRSKQIRIFGYDLFGRPAIQLEGEDDLASRGRRSNRRSESHSTLDSDAAPLDPAEIATLTTPPKPTPPPQIIRSASEERRARKQQKKELKKVAAAAAAAYAEEREEFEGFQGSGASFAIPVEREYPRIPQEFQSRYVAPPTAISPPSPDEDDADLGGELYSRSTRGPPKSKGSRSSNSQSNPHLVPLPGSDGTPSPGLDAPPKKDRTRRKRSKSAKVSGASTTSSTSLASPSSSTQLEHHHFAVVQPDDDMEVVRREGFPSSGFGGGKHGKAKEVAALLARRD